MTELRPSQAADVIQWFHAAENDETRQKGWKDKVTLGLAALHAARVVPGLETRQGDALLTHREASMGMEYIEGPTPSAAVEAYLNSPPREPDWAELRAGDRRDFDEAS